MWSYEVPFFRPFFGGISPCIALKHRPLIRRTCTDESTGTYLTATGLILGGQALQVGDNLTMSIYIYKIIFNK